MVTFNETVGFIGFGDMSQLMVKHRMFGEAAMVAYDAGDPTALDATEQANVADVTFAEAVKSDTIVLSVPAAALHSVVSRVMTHLKDRDEQPLVVDVSGVKSYPTSLFEGILPQQEQVLLCHPLFGPSSAQDSLKGRAVFVTQSKGNKAATLLEAWRDLGLSTFDIEPDEHDKLMAIMQLVPRILGAMAPDEDFLRLALSKYREFIPPSARAAMQLAQPLESDEVVNSMLAFNPHTDEVIATIEHRLAMLKRRVERTREQD